MRLRCRPALKLGQKPLSPLPAKRGQTRDTDLELQQRLGAIGAPGIGGTGSASLPSGCAKSFARTPPQNQHSRAQDALAPPATRARVPPYPPRSTSNPRLEVLRGGYGGTSGGVAMAHRVKGSSWPTGEPCQWQRCDMPGDGAVAWV